MNTRHTTFFYLRGELLNQDITIICEDLSGNYVYKHDEIYKAFEERFRTNAPKSFNEDGTFYAYSQSYEAGMPKWLLTSDKVKIVSINKENREGKKLGTPTNLITVTP